MTGTGPAGGTPLDPDRNLALELVRATEAAAISSARYVGQGDKMQVDRAAVDAMRPVLGSVGMRGVVVIGEGEKDEAPMLFNGEQVGNGSDPEVDIAVDPVDGTTAAAKGLPDAVAVVGLSERGTMFDPGPCVYMHKLVVPAAAADSVDPAAPVADVLAAVASTLGKERDELTVAVLDRPRHADMVGHQVPARRRRRRGDRGRTARLGGRCPDGHRRNPRGRDRGLRAALQRRGDVRSALPPQRGRANRSGGVRSRPGPGPDHHRPRLR